ncbi:MAG: helix-turn-helix domain-containing protein [Myxococcaceae bacterium]|nr:helix-turn-helix domain-containing protein [Myxococcaceae bacterium]
MGFGAYLKELRTQRQLSLRALAAKGDFGYAYLSRLETARTPPPESTQMLDRLVQALGLLPESTEANELRKRAFEERVKRLPGVPAELSGGQTKLTYEEAARARFVRYLREEEGAEYASSASQLNYDFELVPVVDKTLPPIALKIFRFIPDERDEEVATSRHRYWSWLRDALEAKGVRDVVVKTPWVLNASKRTGEAHAHHIASLIAAKYRELTNQETFTVEGFVIERSKREGRPLMTAVSGVRGPVPLAVTRAELVRLLRKKRAYLPPESSKHRRVLLAVQSGTNVHLPEVLKAFASPLFDDFADLEQVFFDGEKGMHLVYDRDVREAFRTGAVDKLTPQKQQLFEVLLARRLEEHDEFCWDLVRKITDTKHHLRWLKNRDAREALAWFAERLVEQGRDAETWWVVPLLAKDNDPDVGIAFEPPGGETAGLYTVRGATCWLLRALVAKADTEQLKEVLTWVTVLSQDENLYVRRQVTHPLRALALRRSKGHDDAFVAESIKQLTLKFLHDNERWPALVHAIAPAFFAFVDLTAAEVERVASVLLKHPDAGNSQLAARLLVDFAAARQPVLRSTLLSLAEKGTPSFRRQLANLFEDAAVDDSTWPVEAFAALLRGAPVSEVDGALCDVLLAWLARDVTDKKALANYFVTLVQRQTSAPANDPFLSSLLFNIRRVWGHLERAGLWAQMFKAAEVLVEAGAVPSDHDGLLEVLKRVPQTHRKQSEKLLKRFNENWARREEAFLLRLKQSLVFYGARFADLRPVEHMAREDALLFAVAQSRKHASILRVVPDVIAKNADKLNWETLRLVSRQRGIAAELGMVTYLAAETMALDYLKANVEPLKDARPAPENPRYFPEVTSKAERKLADLRSPHAALVWHLRSNVTSESFA